MLLGLSSAQCCYLIRVNALMYAPFVVLPSRVNGGCARSRHRLLLGHHLGTLYQLPNSYCFSSCPVLGQVACYPRIPSLDVRLIFVLWDDNVKCILGFFLYSFYEGHLKSSWTHLITPSRYLVEVR
jgi:hypothetical protein